MPFLWSIYKQKEAFQISIFFNFCYRAILKNNYEEAVNLILKPRPGGVY